jgi:hypothetical protein
MLCINGRADWPVLLSCDDRRRQQQNYEHNEYHISRFHLISPLIG